MAARRLQSATRRRQQASATNFQVGKPERGHMRGESRITCLWPGLRRIWYHGDFSSLAVAVAFAALLDLALGQFQCAPTPFLLPVPLGLGVVGCVLGVRPVARGPRRLHPGGTPLGSQNRQDLFLTSPNT